MGNKIYNWFLAILLVVLVGIVLFFGSSVYTDLNKWTENKRAANEQNNEALFYGRKELSIEKVEENKHESYINPFGDVNLEDDIEERALRFYLYYMTNQKVDAPNNEGFYEITDERINFLLEVLDHKIYRYESIYRDILMRWKNHDYTSILEEHYKILMLLDKKDGRATRTLTSEEEQLLLKTIPH